MRVCQAMTHKCMPLWPSAYSTIRSNSALPRALYAKLQTILSETMHLSLLMTSTSEFPTRRLYFAYGSNLALSQMEMRCPSSPYVAPERLKNWRWQINERGYANIVPVPIPMAAAVAAGQAGEGVDEDGSTRVQAKEKEEVDRYKDAEVWGLLYAMSEDRVDEVALDRYEGVVTGAYDKLELEVEIFHVRPDEEDKGFAIVKGSARSERVLVYVNRRMMEDGKAKKEYVGRMNRGIQDAVEKGVPREYVEKWMRHFISG